MEVEDRVRSVLDKLDYTKEFVILDHEDVLEIIILLGCLPQYVEERNEFAKRLMKYETIVK